MKQSFAVIQTTLCSSQIAFQRLTSRLLSETSTKIHLCRTHQERGKVLTVRFPKSRPVKEFTVPVFPPNVNNSGCCCTRVLKSDIKNGTLYGSPAARVYQLFPLCTRGILQATLICAGHGVKGFQCSPIQKTIWVSSGFVAKHAEDERVGPRRNKEAQETSEVVWILGDRLVI